LVGTELGSLDQELAKLSLYVGNASRIDIADVEALVGDSREESAWKIFDQMGAGQAGEALTLLDRAFEQGEDPHRLLGAFSMQLRRLARAVRIQSRGSSLSAALSEAGVPPYGIRGAEAQIRHLGRQRIDRLYDWLLQTDLGFKGSSGLPERILLEQLLVRLVRPAEGVRPGGR
jgi:DNA polymerase-3 subunit delta